MKQLFLIAALVSIATGAKADVIINSTTFPDDNFRNYLLSQDYGSDGKLTNSEISNIKQLDVEQMDIKYLGGIQHFTALERLYCGHNNLVSLDVSLNTKLEVLHCSSNNLYTLDLSKNTKLEDLFCPSNQLNTLDISKNTALTSLDCSYNQLTALDVSKNTKLSMLSCSENQLTALDVSKNTYLRNLDCFFNQIKGDMMDALIASLPLSSNPSTEKRFEAVSNDADEGNFITSAQVEAAKAKGWTVYWLVFNTCKPYEDGIAINEENFPDAAFRSYLLNLPYGRDGKFVWEELYGTRVINVNDKGIENLRGINYFTRLTSLVCGYNKLTELEVSNPKLKDLACPANQLTSLIVSRNAELETLDCSGNQLTYLNVEENTKLKELNCAMNKFVGYRMDNIISSLPINNDATVAHNFYVKYDDPDEGNIITAEQVAAVKARGWTPYWYNGTGWEPYEGDIKINAENFPNQAFRNFLLAQDYGKDGLLTDGEIKAIKSLNVSSQNIYSLKGIEFFYALTTLTCRFNNLTTLNVSKNTALTGLYCSTNPLAKLDVSKNTALESLECDNNQLTALDVSKNTALTDLHCVNNQLNALDVSKNTALTSLSCFNNQLTALDVSKNTALRTLGCNDNQLTALDVSKNTALELLSCDNNLLSALDVSKNTALKGLYCYKNQIKGEKMDALVASLPKNTTNDIHYFYVNYNTSDEGNVITEAQVADAKIKGWKVYWHNGNDWEPYEVSYAINEKNFPDAAFRNYLLAQDYGKDGKITEDEIKTVTWINVEEMGIKSLKGIEIFTELTSLYCSDNQLTELDVSMNTALESLYCDDNQLTELDLSMNTKLSSLWCQRNQLTKLDVSNTAVKHVLQCYQNQLKGKNMDAFIAGLPINTDEEFPYNLFVYQESPNEGNVMTKAQVAAATARGWTVMMYWENGDMDLYEGITLMGDVNDDGAVDVADIATVIDVMAGKAPEYKDKADVNNDKTVDVADIATIIDIMAGKGDDTQPEEKVYTYCPDSNHPHIIDLGLPSGTKWACCNVGASNPEEYGDRFAFGETETKEVYNRETYIHYDGSANTYHDLGADIAGTQYDAATVNWKAPWRMPSIMQCQELLDNCTSEWTTQNGVKGRKFTGPNGGTIFIPATGYAVATHLYGVGTLGNYWLSTFNNEDGAGSFGLVSGGVHWDFVYDRYRGQSVRPVR